MRILIAEDDPVSRRQLEVLLLKWGYEVTIALDGLDAWRKLQSPGAPRLVILDWMMPGMDGVQVCRELRRTKGQNYFYVILVTAKGRTEDIVEGLETGADDYIAKPFRSEELRVRLRAGQRILDLEEQARQVGRLNAMVDMAAGVAHNFNNILGAVRGYVGFIRQDLTRQGMCTDDADRLVACVSRACHLVTQLMGCARPTLGERKRVGIGSLASDLAAQCRGSLADNVELVVHVRARETQLDVVPEVLLAALLNMCINAQEAMPDGGTLTITAGPARREREPGDAGLALFSIADTGAGIEADVLPKIFDPFFSTKQTVGVGLSLTLTRRIVEDHGGKIEVASAPNLGTVFSVLLPTAPAARRCSQGDEEKHDEDKAQG